MKRCPVVGIVAAATAHTLGCASLQEHERAWIFQPSDRAWGSTAELARGMQDVWIAYESKVTGAPAGLRALWLAAPHPQDSPVVLFLHGTRWDVEGSAPRIRRMQQLGFSVLAIDYRGFGQSTPGLPSEDTAYEDAHAAWDWLAAKYPQRPRYIYGHSLRGAIAIDLAAKVPDERGVIVESTFTSIADVASTMKWGWLPIRFLITQRFDSVDKVARIGSPLLVVHSEDDDLIEPELAATGRKRFLLVEGGTHHSTMSVGFAQYRAAQHDFFQLR